MDCCRWWWLAWPVHTISFPGCIWLRVCVVHVWEIRSNRLRREPFFGWPSTEWETHMLEIRPYPAHQTQNLEIYWLFWTTGWQRLICHVVHSSPSKIWRAQQQILTIYSTYSCIIDKQELNCVARCRHRLTFRFVPVHFIPFPFASFFYTFVCFGCCSYFVFTKGILTRF